MGYMGRVRSLATANLAVLSLRLVQFFFAGIIVGIMASFLHTELASNESASSPYVFVLVVGVLTMITQFIYCFSFYHPLVWCWDAGVATGWIISLFWLLNFVSPLACGWSSFNPFGGNPCAQTRAVLVSQIVLACLWYLTAIIGLWSLLRARRGGGEKA